MGSIRRLASIVLVAATVTGCQPLYGDKAERLHKPEPHKRPIEADLPPPVTPTIDECPNNFHDEVWKENRRDPKMAGQLTLDGDNAVANVSKAKDPAAGAGLVKEAIDKYINALKRDPYDATATLRLAIAYDKVYRKGCALAMLHRLASLSKYPAFRRLADGLADQVNDNTEWFKLYRKEAIAAAGR